MFCRSLWGVCVIALGTAACSATGGSPATATAAAPSNVGPGTGITEVEDLVYLTDDQGSWTLQVAYPDEAGPWPLIVVIPTSMGAQRGVAESLSARGAVVVSREKWWEGAWGGDPMAVFAMDRAACIVSWAQAHATEYGADPAATTVAGYSGSAMAAAWVGLGVADDSVCEDPIAYRPIGLVAGESQFIFHHGRWDPAFASGDPEPAETLDKLINPARWDVAPDLRVALWSAEHPIGETRSVENPPGEDSWIRLRDNASPLLDDLTALGALDDQRIDWHDNALLMEQRLLSAGINVRNEVYNIGHAYTDEVYDLIFSILP